MRYLPLTNSPLLAMVDDEDYEKASKLKWRLRRDGGSRSRGHVISTTTPYVSLHHLVYGKPSGNRQIDHKNNDGLDCQKRNLREATCSQNQWNRGKLCTNTSGFKGVHQDKSGKWVSGIVYSGHGKYLGIFESPIEAAKAYDRAARKFHGEFAKTNFPMRFPREQP